MLLLSRERETQISSLFFFKMSLSFSLSFFLSFPKSFQLSKCQVFLICIKKTEKNRPHTKENKKRKHTHKNIGRHILNASNRSYSHLHAGFEKTKTTTTKRGDHRDETRERETSFVSARLPETTTSFCRERKRERRAKAQRDVFVAINQFERRKR